MIEIPRCSHRVLWDRTPLERTVTFGNPSHGLIRLLHIEREVGMPQVVELVSESEGFSLEHGGLQPAGGFADGRVTASRRADQSVSADSRRGHSTDPNRG